MNTKSDSATVAASRDSSCPVSTPVSPAESASGSAPQRAGTASAPPAWTADILRSQLPAFRIDDTQVALGYGEQWRFESAQVPEDAVVADEGQAGVTVLLEYGLIRVAGKDAEVFLQGQLTNDVKAVQADRAQASGYCNPKGRLLGTFWIWREAESSFLLACSRDLSTMLAKRLRMFVMRSKLVVERLDHEIVLLGSVGERAIDAIAGAAGESSVGSPIRLPLTGEPARAMLPVTVAGLGAVVAGLAQRSIRWRDTDRWRLLEIESGIARINTATQERFVPQMLNFERTDGVSFTKGCYPGQEVVARTQYLGKSKRRMFLGRGSGPLPACSQDVLAAPSPTDDDALVDAGATAEAVGMIVLAAPTGRNQWLALFECRIAATMSELFVGATPLVPVALPYPLEDSETGSPQS